MTNIIRNSEQSGRSMVEMLGVLAIVGVLSIGGISGYSKAMAKYKVNKTLDQVSMLVTNIRSIFGNQTSYSGLNTKTVIDFEMMDKDMLNTASTLINPYQGSIVIANDGRKFSVQYLDLPKVACSTIASSNWGDSAASGLESISVGGQSAKGTAATGTTYNWTDATNKLPISFAAAGTSCSSDNYNTIKWVYY